MTEFLSFTNLGGRWQKSPKTARRIAEDALPMFRIGGSWRVRLSDVEIYEKHSCIEKPAEPNGLKALVSQAVSRARDRSAS